MLKKHQIFHNYNTIIQKLIEVSIAKTELFDVKDTRTNYEETDPSTVLDGEIDEFIFKMVRNKTAKTIRL